MYVCMYVCAYIHAYVFACAADLLGCLRGRAAWGLDRGLVGFGSVLRICGLGRRLGLVLKSMWFYHQPHAGFLNTRRSF